MHFTIVGGRYDRPPGWRQSRATPLGVALPQTPTPNSPRPNPPRAVSEGLRLKLRHRATPKMQEKVRCCVAVPALCSPLPSIGGTRFAQLLRRRIYRAANSAHATLRRRRPRPRPRPRRSVNLEESCDSGARRAPPRAQGGRGATASSSRCDTARWAAGALPAPSTALPDGQNKVRGEGERGVGCILEASTRNPLGLGCGMTVKNKCALQRVWKPKGGCQPQLYSIHDGSITALQ